MARRGRACGTWAAEERRGGVECGKWARGGGEGGAVAASTKSILPPAAGAAALLLWWWWRWCGSRVQPAKLRLTAAAGGIKLAAWLAPAAPDRGVARGRGVNGGWAARGKRWPSDGVMMRNRKRAQ